MNAFNSARLIEAKGMAILGPFLDETANGRLVMMSKGPLSRALQQTVGDAIFQLPNGRVWSVEIKIEHRETGNLFLESWSNRNIEDRDRQVAIGSNPGWMFKLQADLLLYYFLDCDKLFVFDFFKLKRWAFDEWRVARYPERRQRAREQLNDGWGWCVPLSVLAHEVGYRLLYPKKLVIFPSAIGPWSLAS